MKKHLLLFAAFLLFTTTAFAQSPALTFLQKMNTEMDQVQDVMLDYISISVHSKNQKRIEKRRTDVVNALNLAIGNVTQAATPAGAADPKKGTLEVFKMYLNVYNTEYKASVALAQSSEDSYEAMEKYYKTIEAAEQKLEAASQRADTLYTAFAAANNITLVPEQSKRSEKIKKVNALNDYSRKINLSFFRVSKAANNLSKAFGDKNTETAQTQLEELKRCLKSTLDEMNAIQPFLGDNTYKVAILEVLAVYGNLAETGYVDMAELCGKKDLTQADVNRYNKAVQQLNTKLPPAVDKLNRVQDEFSMRHTPRSFKK